MKVVIIGGSGHYGYALEGIKEDRNISITGIAPGSEGKMSTRFIRQRVILDMHPGYLMTTEACWMSKSLILQWLTASLGITPK